MKFLCVIPARYESTRFPGKPLADINGAPMIQWVYQRATAAQIFHKVIVATDDQKILDTVLSFGGNAIMTPKNIPTGTDRVCYVAQKENVDIVVNLQGDEPLISPQLLCDVCKPYNHKKINVTTAIKKISKVEELENPNVVKVVIDKDNNAIYFSRATIPYSQESKESKALIKEHTFYKHIGIYTYRKNFLIKLTQLPRGRLESIEQLEQLRILENNYKISTVITNFESLGIDSPEDLHLVTTYINKNKLKLEVNNEKM